MLAVILAAAVTPAAAQTVIGVAVPSSGPKTELGQAMLQAVRAGIAQRTGAGSAAGLRLVEVDDACQAAAGTVAAERLVAERPVLVLGHPCSNAAIAAAKVYARAEVPFVAIGPRAPDLTAKPAGPAVFRIGGRDDREPSDTVAVFAPILRGVRVAVVHDRTAMAHGLAQAVAAGLKTSGVADVTVETIVAGEREYGGLVQRLKSLNPGAIYFAGFPAEAALIFDGARSAGITARFIGCSALTGLKRPWLSVMAPRVLGEAEVQTAVSRLLDAVLAQANGGEPLAGALARQFDEEGDEPQPSFVPEPFPLE